MRVLVPGGAGFLGRSVVVALEARGHTVVVGSRKGSCGGGPEGGASRRRRMRFESLLSADAWAPHLAGIDAVVNCVGILRERGRETYDRLHHLAPAALAAACAARGVRLVHVSALGLDARARSGFIASKRRGEAAIRDSGADYTLARPSLLEGEGGFGARWLRALARMPLWFIPADATGLIAALDVGDAGRAIARLADLPGRDWREADLGGLDHRTLEAHLAALRGDRPPPRVVRLPALAARIASHACDALHVSPFSFGHLELLRRDNVPARNRLTDLLDGEPRRISAPRAAASAPGRAVPPPIAARDGGNTPIARAP